MEPLPDFMLEVSFDDGKRVMYRTRTVPDRAEVLFAEAEKFTSSRYAKYKRLAAE